MAHQDTTSDKPAHTPGTPRGEHMTKGPARNFNRSEDDATGVNVQDRKPIDSRMPVMPPA